MHTLEKRSYNMKKIEKKKKDPLIPKVRRIIISYKIMWCIKIAAIIFKDKKSNWNKKERKNEKSKNFYF
jgi:hypothetical protein